MPIKSLPVYNLLPHALTSVTLPCIVINDRWIIRRWASCRWDIDVVWGVSGDGSPPQPETHFCHRVHVVIRRGAIGEQFGWMRRDGVESVEGRAKYDEGMMVIW